MSKKMLYRSIQMASLATLLASGSAFADGRVTVDTTDRDSRDTTTIRTDEDKPRSADFGTAISDTAITAKVKAKFASDSRLKNTDINVETANGVVNLTGSAPSLTVKRTATDLASNVNGVVDVDNKIITPAGAEVSSMEAKSKSATDKTERVASDSWITTKVKAALLADHRTKGTEISVKTVHKVVHLTGTVGSRDEVASAKEVARGIKHVRKVDTSGLKVGSTS
jgi:hyperosmotically inducible protein